MRTNLMRIDPFVQELECKCLNEQDKFCSLSVKESSNLH